MRSLASRVAEGAVPAQFVIDGREVASQRRVVFDRFDARRVEQALQPGRLAHNPAQMRLADRRH